MTEPKPQDLDTKFKEEFTKKIGEWGDRIVEGSNLGNIRIEDLTDDDKELFLDFIKYVEEDGYGTFDSDMNKKQKDSEMELTFVVKIKLRQRNINKEDRTEEAKKK
ncbi:MAG: hypothetical protein ABIA91_01785 [Patescibacteria group bacterium]